MDGEKSQLESIHLNKPAYCSKHEDIKRKRRKRHQIHTMWAREERKNIFFFIFFKDVFEII